MNLLSKLEKRLGWMAVGHLPIYIVTAQAMLYLWSWVNPEQAGLLMLDRVAVQYGHEYWRLLTFLFVIPLQNPLFAFFYLYLLYFYGTSLEHDWGSFPFTLFYLIGAVGTGAVGFFWGSINGTFFLNMTIFLAFAALHPDFELYFFFVIPIKIKWMAWVTWAWFAYLIWVAPMSIKGAILISLANYILFFGKSHFQFIVENIQRYQHHRRFKDWNK